MLGTQQPEKMVCGKRVYSSQFTVHSKKTSLRISPCQHNTKKLDRGSPIMMIELLWGNSDPFSLSTVYCKL